jgi:hypothetical protein
MNRCALNPKQPLVLVLSACLLTPLVAASQGDGDAEPIRKPTLKTWHGGGTRGSACSYTGDR